MPLSNIDACIPLLSLLRQNGCSAPYVWLLNNSPYPGVETKAVLREMLSGGLVSGQLRAYNTLHLASAGIVALSQFKHDEEKRRDEESKLEAKERSDDAKQTRNLHKQFRHNWNVALVSAAFGAVLTLLIEYLVSLIH